jgi:hypothetical protein
VQTPLFAPVLTSPIILQIARRPSPDGYDKADRIVAMDIVIDPRRQKLSLVAITTFDVVHAAILANQLAKWNQRPDGKLAFSHGLDRF